MKAYPKNGCLSTFSYSEILQEKQNYLVCVHPTIETQILEWLWSTNFDHKKS